MLLNAAVAVHDAPHPEDTDTCRWLYFPADKPTREHSILNMFLSLLGHSMRE